MKKNKVKLTLFPNFTYGFKFFNYSATFDCQY